MKKDIADLWVAALRFGTYTQGRYRLRTATGGLDCLGVLCDISGLGEWIGKEYVKGDVSVDGGLHPAVQAWAGMKTGIGVITNNECLSRLNDDGKTFAEIADVIELNYEKL